MSKKQPKADPALVAVLLETSERAYRMRERSNLEKFAEFVRDGYTARAAAKMVREGVQ